MNGVPMTLKLVRSRLSPQDLFSFYEARYRAQARSEFHRSSTANRLLLAIRSPYHYITIQVQQTISGSEGTITVTAAPALLTTTATSKFPRPATTTVLSLQEYEDAGIESELISLASPRSVTQESRAFLHELTRAGWQVVRQQPMREAAQSIVIEVQHGANHALITLQPDHVRPSTTAVVVVWKKS